MNYAPFNWYEQECLRCKAHFEALPRAPYSLRPVSLKVWSQRYCLSVIQAGTPVHKTQSSVLTVHRVRLATAYVGLVGYCGIVVSNDPSITHITTLLVW